MSIAPQTIPLLTLRPILNFIGNAATYIKFTILIEVFIV